MTFRTITCVSLLLLIITGCETNQEEPSVIGDYPDVQELEKEKRNTAFVTTFDSEIDLSKNTVYASTLSFCWDRFKQEYGEVTGISKKGLLQLDQSDYFKNSLQKDEVKTTLLREGNKVTIKSFFDMQLPFKKPFDELGLKFKGKMVYGFGTTGRHSQIEIIYYNSDDDFALRLLPENEDHEILVCKSDFSKSKSLYEVFSQVNAQIPAETKPSDAWKLKLNDKDEVAVPDLAFNLQTRFHEIEGAKYKTGPTPWIVIKAWQQNALTMNSKGVAAKSKAEIQTEATAIKRIEEIKIPVKRLILNSNYVVFLKRKESKWPYFAAYMTNDRWMKKI